MPLLPRLSRHMKLLLPLIAGSFVACADGASPPPAPEPPDEQDFPRVLVTSSPASAFVDEVLAPSMTVALQSGSGTALAAPTRFEVRDAAMAGGVDGRLTIESPTGSATFDSVLVRRLGRVQLQVTASPQDVSTFVGIDVIRRPLAAAPRASWAVTGVTVVPMDTERQLPGHTVVVVDGVITAMGPDGSIPIPAGATVIDGSGKWLAPGLVDFHTHERALPSWPDDFAGNALMFLANGVTSIVNMGDFTEALLDERVAIAGGAYPGPNIYVGHFVRAPAEGGAPTHVVSDATSAVALVRRAKAAGYDFLKVYSLLNAAAYDALMAEAAREGLAVAGHVPREVGPDAALAKGQMMVVHTSEFFSQLTGLAAIPALADRIAATGAAIGPTLYVTERITRYGLDTLGGASPLSTALGAEGVEFMHEGSVAGWRQMYRERVDIRTPVDRTSFLNLLRALTLALHERGVLLLAGSDEIGIPGIVPGFSMHGELAQLEVAGLNRFAVLATATRNAGRFIEQRFRRGPAFGTVAPGSRADLVLLASDPLLSLGAYRTPAGVMTNGRYYDGGALRDQLESLRVTR